MQILSSEIYLVGMLDEWYAMSKLKRIKSEEEN